MNTISISTLYYSYQHKLPIDLGQVVRLEGTGNYTSFILSNGSSHLSSKSLCVYAPSLPVGFVRVHKSCIVNRRFVKDLDKTTKSVVLSNKIKIKVARRRWGELKRFLSENT